jgi:HK97 family phage prohead protease
VIVRAWSTLEIKAVDKKTRTIQGIASTISTDRMGDIVDPKGATYALPLPLLSQHQQSKPIGHVVKARATADHIEIEARGPLESGLGYLEEAWAQVELGLVRGLSIGFQPLELEAIRDAAGDRTGGYRFKRWQWLELSAVTIPANAEANISTVKRFDPWGAWSNGPGQDPESFLAALAAAPSPKPGLDADTVQRRAAAAIVQARRVGARQRHDASGSH